VNIADLDGPAQNIVVTKSHHCARQGDLSHRLLVPCLLFCNEVDNLQVSHVRPHTPMAAVWRRCGGLAWVVRLLQLEEKCYKI
jgi:hypothetical protein